jgi:hypothetical protein
MVRSLSQGNVSHVAHDDILRHVGRTIENDVLVTPSESISVTFPRDEPSRGGRG